MASNHPTIPSRYVASLRRSWDATLATVDIIERFRESIITMNHEATSRHTEKSLQLLEILSVLGATRKPQGDMTAGEGSKSSLKEQKEETEKDITQLEHLITRCKDLLSELEEHVGNFTDAFIEAMKRIAEEIKCVPPVGGEYCTNIVEYVPSLMVPTLLDTAREVPPETIDSTCFAVSEMNAWQPTCYRNEHEVRKPHHKFSMHITCCCIDESETELKMFYIGTSSGKVLGVPFDVLNGDDSPRTEHAEGDGPIRKLRGGPPVDITQLMNQRPLPENPNQQNESESPIKKQCTSLLKVTEHEGVRMFRGHVYPVISIKLIFHSENKVLLTTSLDKTIRVHNAVTGELLNILIETISVIPQASYHVKSGHIVSCSNNGVLAAWDHKIGERIAVLASTGGMAMHSIYVDNTSGEIFFGLRNGHIYGVLPHQIHALRAHNKESVQHCQYVHAFLPTGAQPLRCATGAPEENEKEAESLEVVSGGHTVTVTYLVSMVGFLFSGDASGSIHQWDILHNKHVRCFHGHVDDITSIVLSEDGFIFTSSKDALVLIWNMSDGNRLARLNRHFGPVCGLGLGVIPKKNKLLKVADLSMASPSPSKTSNGGMLPSANASSTTHHVPQYVNLSEARGKYDVVLLSASYDESVVLWSMAYDLKDDI